MNTIQNILDTVENNCILLFSTVYTPTHKKKLTVYQHSFETSLTFSFFNNA